MEWNQAEGLLKGGEAVILRDENERFITENTGNNNTANGPLAILYSRRCLKIFPYKSLVGKLLLISL